MTKIKHWNEKVDQLFLSHDLHPKVHDNEYDILEEFYERFLESGWYYHSLYGDGSEMLDVFADRDSLPTTPTKNQRIDFSTIFPSLVNNKTYQKLYPKLINVRTKGIGIGELFLTFILKDGQFDSSVDLQLGDGSWEVKNSKTGGCIKGNKNTQLRVVDDLVKKYFDGMNPFQISGTDSRLIWDSDTVWNFTRKLWPELSEDQVDTRTDIFLNSGKNPHLRNQRVGHDILKSYQEIDEWTGLVLIDDEDAIFLVDVEDTEFVDQNLKLTVQGKRGGDTNAVGDGYGKIFKTPKTGSWQRKLSA
tara:strand:- start:10853 stop:11761 length:909 start_codon:yes stop_codon:yes gene_type:complete